MTIEVLDCGIRRPEPCVLCGKHKDRRSSKRARMVRVLADGKPAVACHICLGGEVWQVGPEEYRYTGRRFLVIEDARVGGGGRAG